MSPFLPHVGIAFVIALLLGGVLGMRELARTERAPQASIASATAAPTVEPSRRPAGLPAGAAGAEGPEVVERVQRLPGTVWLEAPEVMEVGKVYDVAVMVETSGFELHAIDLALMWPPGDLRVRPAAGRAAPLKWETLGKSWQERDQWRVRRELILKPREDAVWSMLQIEPLRVPAGGTTTIEPPPEAWPLLVVEPSEVITTSINGVSIQLPELVERVRRTGTVVPTTLRIVASGDR